MDGLGAGKPRRTLRWLARMGGYGRLWAAGQMGSAAKLR